MRKPNFFILGAKKCGTTSMAAWLSEHPQVYMSPIKEPGFFCNDIVPDRKRCLSQYEQLFCDVRPEHHIVGEASTSYLYSAVALDNILNYADNPRFLVMIRNPIEMAVALHEEMLYQGDEHVIDFYEAWHLQDRRVRGEGVSRSCRDPKLLLYGQICKIGGQLRRLFGKVAKDQVCTILLEDIRISPRKEYLEVLNALQIEDDGREDFPVHNKGKARKSDALVRLRRILGDMKQSIGIPAQFGRNFQQKLDNLNRVVRQRSPLPTAIREELQEYFEPDVQQLSRLLGRDLNHWVQTSRDY